MKCGYLQENVGTVKIRIPFLAYLKTTRHLKNSFPVREFEISVRKIWIHSLALFS